jgi:hypothetical protein
MGQMQQQGELMRQQQAVNQVNLEKLMLDKKANTDIAAAAKSLEGQPNAQLELMKRIPQIYTQYGMVDKAQEWNNRRTDHALKLAGLADTLVKNKNSSIRMMGINQFADALGLMSDSLGISPDTIAKYKEKALASGDEGQKVYQNMIGEVGAAVEAFGDPKNPLYQNKGQLRKVVLSTVGKYKGQLDEDDLKSATEQVNKTVEGAIKDTSTPNEIELQVRAQAGDQKARAVLDRMQADKVNVALASKDNALADELKRARLAEMSTKQAEAAKIKFNGLMKSLQDDVAAVDKAFDASKGAMTLDEYNRRVQGIKARYNPALESYRPLGLWNGWAQPAQQQTSGQSKQLDATTAQGYLAKAGGNKDKARELARRDGYTF